MVLGKKQAVVSLGTGPYIKILNRLKESLVGKFDGSVFTFTNENQVGAPPHSQNNYAFKLYAIETVLSMGYTSILWLDSSVYAVKNIQPVFDIINNKGYFMMAAGNWVGNWCNDRGLEAFGLTREQAMTIPMFSAGMTGLNFLDPIAAKFFHSWKQAMNNGLFNGDWGNHRHEMTIGSILAWQGNMSFEPGDHFFQYGAPEDALINDTIVAKLQGI